MLFFFLELEQLIYGQFKTGNFFLFFSVLLKIFVLDKSVIFFWSIRMKVTNSLTQSPRLWSEEEEFWEAMCQLNKQDKGPGPGRRGPCAKIFGVLREGSGCVWCGPLSHQFCNFQEYRIWQNGTSAIAIFTFYWLWLGYVQGSIRSRVFF